MRDLCAAGGGKGEWASQEQACLFQKPPKKMIRLLVRCPFDRRPSTAIGVGCDNRRKDQDVEQVNAKKS